MKTLSAGVLKDSVLGQLKTADRVYDDLMRIIVAAPPESSEVGASIREAVQVIFARTRLLVSSASSIGEALMIATRPVEGGVLSSLFRKGQGLSTATLKANLMTQATVADDVFDAIVGLVTALDRMEDGASREAIGEATRSIFEDMKTLTQSADRTFDEIVAAVGRAPQP